MMKIAVLAFALFAAVIAEPEAEASPDAYYGYAGYGHGYGHGYGYGLYGRYGYGGYGYGGYGRGYGYGHYLGKKSADACRSQPSFVLWCLWTPIPLCPTQISRCIQLPTRQHPSCHPWNPPIAQA